MKSSKVYADVIEKYTEVSVVCIHLAKWQYVKCLYQQ